MHAAHVVLCSFYFIYVIPALINLGNKSAKLLFNKTSASLFPIKVLPDKGENGINRLCCVNAFLILLICPKKLVLLN